MEQFLSDHTTMMVEEMQYGPFICAYGIKLHDSDFNYDLGVDQMLEKMSELRRRKAILIKETVPKKKIDEEETPDEVARVFETTQVSKLIFTMYTAIDNYYIVTALCASLLHTLKSKILSCVVRLYVRKTHAFYIVYGN